MHSLLDRLQRHRTAAERIFCHLISGDGAQAITFTHLFRRAETYAHRYRRSGLGDGDVVFIVLRHSPDLLYAFVGALIAGCVPAFLAPLTEKQLPSLYWPAMAELFTRVGAAGLVVGRDDLAAMDAAGCAGGIVRICPEDPLPEPEIPVAWAQRGDGDLAFLQFSSGTTGRRKGVMLSHRMVLEQLDAYRHAIALDEGGVIASWLPLYHDMGLIACLVMPLVFGVPLVLLDPLEWVRDPASLFRWIEHYRATHCWLPNFAFNHLAATSDPGWRGDLSSVRSFVNCSEPCKDATFNRFLERFAGRGVRADQLQTCYAMAEAVFCVTQSPLGRPVRRLAVDPAALAAGQAEAPQPDGPATMLLSVGVPLPGIEVAVFGGEGERLPDRRVGEIGLRGSFLFEGYFRSEEETGQAFRDGWYRTGDLGFSDGGELYITGRSKDLLIINGRNYYSHDIEALLGEVGGIRPGRAVAVGADSPETGSEELVILAEWSAGHEAEADRRTTARAIRLVLQQHLNLSARVEIFPPGWLVKTTSGKISRRTNRDRYLELRRHRLETQEGKRAP